MTWNFNMDEAPKGGWVKRDTGRKDKAGQPIVADEYETVRILAAGSNGLVTISKWLHESARWEMFSEKSPPKAWQTFPIHPDFEAR